MGSQVSGVTYRLPFLPWLERAKTQRIVPMADIRCPNVVCSVEAAAPPAVRLQMDASTRFEGPVTELRKLVETEIRERLKSLNAWSLDQGKLYKEYKFKDFVAAFAFMTKVAEAAEAVAHHPEWFNVYDTVQVHLSTHEVGGISERDFDLARKMDDLAKR